jgi:hypothetical protein
MSKASSQSHEPTRGVVYVAWGDEFVSEAKTSAISLKKQMDCPVSLITPTPIEDHGPFDEIIIEPFSRSYRDKILMRKSPYDHTIFLDTDTVILEPLDQLFDLLERFDLAYQPSAPSDHYKLDGVPLLAFYEPSAGILVWRNSPVTQQFFDSWDLEYTRQEAENGQGAWDQRSLRAAAWSSDVRIAMLGGDWQLCSFEFGICMNKVKLVHGRGRLAQQALAYSNTSIGPRVYMPGIGFFQFNEEGSFKYLRLSLASFGQFLKRSLRLFLHGVGIWRLPTSDRKM